MRAWVLAALLLASGLVGCVGSDDEVQPQSVEAGGVAAEPLELDPTLPGNLSVERQLFDFGYTLVDDVGNGQAYPVKLNGSVHYPDAGEDPRPLVVFIHGRHSTCRLADDSFRTFATHACPNAPPVVEPIDSWRGYRYAAETLASKGYIVATINANDVNDRDLASLDAGVTARAQLVLDTLDAFARANRGEDPSFNEVGGADPLGSEGLEEALEGRVDLDRIGLMGHSRGGEGVVRAVTYDREVNDGAHDIDAVFSMAPIDFTDQTPSGVDLAVLLPYCDGDVFDLQGAHIYDRTRLVTRDPSAFKLQVVAMGANHNFYNTVWTRDGGDAGRYTDDHCGEFREDGGGRLAPEDQQRHGEALINAFFEASLGGETRYTDWFAGRALAPASACPGGEGPCRDVLHTSYVPPASERLLVEDGAEARPPAANELGGENRAEGFAETSICETDACPGWNVQGARSLTLAWDEPASYTLEVPDEHRDLANWRTVTFRVGVNHGHEANPPGDPQDLSLRIADEDGAEASVAVGDHASALFYPPGTAEDPQTAKVTLNQASVPLAAVAGQGVDLERVEEIGLVTDRTPSGSIQVNDLMLQR